MATTVSTWTTADLAHLTQLASDLDIVNSNQQYCRHCTVASTVNADICDSCINELVQWLEEREIEHYTRISEEAMYQKQFSL